MAKPIFLETDKLPHIGKAMWEVIDFARRNAFARKYENKESAWKRALTKEELGAIASYSHYHKKKERFLELIATIEEPLLNKLFRRAIILKTWEDMHARWLFKEEFLDKASLLYHHQGDSLVDGSFSLLGEVIFNDKRYDAMDKYKMASQRHLWKIRQLPAHLYSLYYWGYFSDGRSQPILTFHFPKSFLSFKSILEESKSLWEDCLTPYGKVEEVRLEFGGEE
jgi:hypothetical protein